jgi:HK97 gp10 family phage protein
MADFRIVFDETALRDLLQSPQGATGQAISKAAVRIERVAKQLCPVDTGRLRSSITREVGRDGRGLYATVGTNVEYAPYVELGTRFMGARPFLRPALASLAVTGL